MRLSSLFVLLLQVSFHLQGQHSAPSFQYQAYAQHQLITQERLDQLTDHNVPYALYQKAHELREPALLFPSEKPRLVVNCSYSVYTLQNDSVVNLYSNDNKGFTCSTFPFLLNDTLFFLGGYGFWQGHAALNYFSPGLQEWSLQSVRQSPANYIPGVTFEKDGHIYALLGRTINTITEKEVKSDPHGYRLNLQEEKWERLSLDWEGEPYLPKSHYPIGQYSLENFQVYLTRRSTFDVKIVAIHKPSLKIYELNDPPQKVELIYTEGDTLHFLNHTGLHSRVFDRSKMGPAIASITLQAPSNTNAYFLWIGGALILFVAGLVFLRRRKTKNASSPLQKAAQQPAQEPVTKPALPEFHQRLLDHEGVAISVMTFDKITGVDQLDNMDSRRSKRAQILREINARFNEQGAGLTIERRMSPQDKRYFEYKIRYVEHQH